MYRTVFLTDVRAELPTASPGGMLPGGPERAPVGRGGRTRHHREVAFGSPRVSARSEEEEWRPPSSRASVALSNRNAHPNKENADGEIHRHGCPRHELHGSGGERARQEVGIARACDERSGPRGVSQDASWDDSSRRRPPHFVHSRTSTSKVRDMSVGHSMRADVATRAPARTRSRWRTDKTLGVSECVSAMSAGADVRSYWRRSWCE